MDKNKLTDSLTRFILENRRYSQDGFRSVIETYNEWALRSGYVINDTKTIAWILQQLKLLMKSNLQTMESIYKRCL